MILLDTDTLTYFLVGNVRVLERARTASNRIATTIVSRIEVLRGRFDSVLKAADGAQIVLAQERLALAEQSLHKVDIIPFDAAAAAEFDRLRRDKKLKKIGRGDLLIASITLANRATLVTRNLRHFRQVSGLKLENWID